jgi:hypothetical protein
VSSGILKEGNAFVLKGQIDQEDFLLIRFTLENEPSSFFQTSKTLNERSSVESQKAGTLIYKAIETSKLARITCFYFPKYIASYNRVYHVPHQGTKT